MNHTTSTMLERYYFKSYKMYPNGVISCAILDRDQTIKGIDLYQNTEVCFYESGRLQCGWLKGNRIFHGRSYKSGTKFSLFDHDSVRLKEGYLHGNQEIDFINFMDNGPVRYYFDTGNVARGFLHGDQNMQGISFMDGNILGLYNNKMVSYGVSSRDQVVQDVLIYKDEYISLSYNGELMHKDKETERSKNEKEYNN